ncbi:porin [Vibrio sonorensis]|uniref:porin n=1 Tax=Vibrio sonorensis TaxID=1004316 RepID=UPI0008D9208F|nr:porin [Vibrio sonorensis]
MDKMFKRTLIGAAVASVAFSGSALAKPATDTVDLYGQVAISIAQNVLSYKDKEVDKKEQTIGMDNESRMGIRGSVDFERGPKFIWQLEGGDVGDDGSGSGLGVRDTYGGFDFAEGGTLKFGRQLTPLFEIVDGYTGQSSGTGFTMGNTGNVNYERQPNMFRYDSADLSGFSFDLALGRGDEGTKGSNVYGLGAQYRIGVATFKVGYEYNNEKKANDKTIPSLAGKTIKSNALVAGVNLDFDNFGAHLAYLAGEIEGQKDLSGHSAEADAIKVGAYFTGVENWTFNLNYGANSDVDFETPTASGKVINNTSAWTGQAMYSIDPAAVVYARVVAAKNEVAAGSHSDFGWRLGVEYYF